MKTNNLIIFLKFLNSKKTKKIIQKELKHPFVKSVLKHLAKK